jgi:hypothetical protein
MTDDAYEAAEEAFGSHPDQVNIHKLDKTHRKILLICEDYPEAVNDRPLLLAKFYENDWDNSKSLYDNFSRLTRPETVVRRFRDLREWGYVKQSEKADKANYDAMKSERERHSQNPTLKIVNGEKIMYLHDDFVENIKNAHEQMRLI